MHHGYISIVTSHVSFTICTTVLRNIVTFCATVVMENAKILRKMSTSASLRKQFGFLQCRYYHNEYIRCGRMSDQDDLLSDIS